MSSRTKNLLKQAKIRREAIERLSEQVEARVEKNKPTKKQSKDLVEEAQEVRPLKTPPDDGAE